MTNIKPTLYRSIADVNTIDKTLWFVNMNESDDQSILTLVGTTDRKTTRCIELIESTNMDIYDNGYFLITTASSIDGQNVNLSKVTITEKGVYYGEFIEESLKGFIQVHNEGVFTHLYILPTSLYETYLLGVSYKQSVNNLVEKYPVYNNIIIENDDTLTKYNLSTILDLLSPEEVNKFVTNLTDSRPFKHKQIVDEMLSTLKISKNMTLLSQEEKVEAFLTFSKLDQISVTEIVSDEIIDNIKSSKYYKHIVDKLKEKGYGLSETQQKNTLQSVGLLTQYYKHSVAPIVYNLSDMGSGKTLMTVESIFLLDLGSINNYLTSNREKLDQYINEIRLPDKHIIAPKLSIKSSWVNTFKIFYDVNTISENEYELTVEYEGITYKSKLYTSPFTVKGGKIYTEEILPMYDYKAYLIIDEIHQIVKRKVGRTKFFSKNVVPHSDYYSFVLSGTLSNLTTQEWYNFSNFMGITINEEIKNHTSRDEFVLNNKRKHLQSRVHNTYRTLSDFGKIVETDYHDLEPTTIDAKKYDSKEDLFHLMYSPKIINTNNQTMDNALKNNEVELVHNSDILDTPNFELFYTLVGSNAITAESIQIAEELFGKQKTQHNSDVIKTVSSLKPKDLELLKTVHELAQNHKQYKSTLIANKLNNALLNMNDGLQTENVFDIVLHHSKVNTKFMEYLTSLDDKLLFKLRDSTLVKSSKLEDTEKFKIVKDLLEKEKNETFLIVVNDYKAMETLSKALGYNHLTKEQVREIVHC